MARSLEQILRDIESLTAATNTVDQDLKSLYQRYLEVLSKAVRQQLVLAAYHLCTQVYPEAFLKLSVNQREKVQTGIRKIAGQGQSQLEQLSRVITMDVFRAMAEKEAVSPDEETDSQASTEEEASTPPVATEADPEILETAEKTTANEPTLPTASDQEDGASLPEAIAASEIAQRLSGALSLLAAFGSEPLSPINLAKRHVLLERQLRAILQTVSNLANYLLKQAHVLPDLPEMVLAAAAEAETGESGQTAPNLLNVLVEMGRDRSQNDLEEEDSLENKEALDEEDPESSMTHLVAINLRLADIEFADAHTALWRGKLQEVLARLKRLGSQYQKLQREKAQAEAEHAWRATWFEE
ncbi:MAG: hypothetical protein ACFBSF_01720 [Leptolyngbyaceae cyanobacterium]